MRLVLSRLAETDLEQIADYIALDNPLRAQSCLRDIKERIYRLPATPKAYPLLPRYERSGIRRCVEGQYLIFYRMDDDTLRVLRILHGAMDYEPLLFPR